MDAAASPSGCIYGGKTRERSATNSYSKRSDKKCDHDHSAQSTWDSDDTERQSDEQSRERKLTAAATAEGR